MKIINHVINIFFILSIILVMYTLFILGYSFNINKLEYIDAPSIDFSYNIDNINYEKRELRYEIENIVGHQIYFYKEKDLLSKNLYGRTFMIPRLIEMDKNLSNHEYIFYFTHEYVHLKYLTKCERWVDFKTFTLLYESGNNDFKNVALWYAYRDMKGYINEDYSCWGYIYNYLKYKEI